VLCDGTRLGKVYLVGAGPGDPDLITLKGKKCLEEARVVLYDQLVNDELLQHVAESAELIYVGKQAGKRCANQRAIEELLVRKAREGKTIVGSRAEIHSCSAGVAKRRQL